MEQALAGKVIIVTGASSGIGRAIALALARERVKLFLVARREDRLRELETEVQKAGSEACVMPLDLRDRDAPAGMIEAAAARFGRIDVLINNAAFGYFGSVEETPPEVVREIFEVNFESVLAAIQRVLPVMRRQGSGHIINISSVAGKRGLPMSGIYSATKSALNAISESLRVELHGTGIHVSVVNPASTRTEFGDVIRKGRDAAGDFKPIGHQQSAEEVADAVVRCIRTPRVEVYPYARSRIVTWLNAIAPAMLDAITIRVLRDRLQATRGEPHP